MNPSKILQTAELVRRARRAAGLTQRELAQRAKTAQSVVARIETGMTSPTISTLERLLAAAGFELNADLSPLPVKGSHMLADVARILSLSPTDRLIEVRNFSRLAAAARPSGPTPYV